MPHSDRKDFYNRIAGFYDLLSNWSERRLRTSALDALNAKPGEAILEIGFGTGHALAHLATAVAPGGHVFGSDVSDKMGQQASRRLRKSGADKAVTIDESDARSLRHADNTMNGVFLSFTLELFSDVDIPVVLSECRRVLHPGGRIVVVSLSNHAFRKWNTRLYHWLHDRYPNVIDCRPIAAGEWIEKAGFVIKDHRRINWWLPIEIVVGVKV